MPNPLTGQFDVVVQVSVPTINRLLATIHQRGAGGKGPSALHTLSMRVGDVIVKKKSKIGSGSPAEAAAGAKTKTGALDSPVMISVVDDVARLHGTAEVQVSTPTITLPGGASDVTVHCQVMAHFTPDADSAPAPEFVHGEFRITCPVAVRQWGGSQILDIDFRSLGVGVEFVPAPGSGFTTDDRELVEEQVRSFLRTRLEPVSEPLPEKTPLLRLGKLPGPKGPRVPALLAKLAGPLPAESAVAEIVESMLKSSDDFAVAVGDAYIRSKIDLAPLRTMAASRTVTARWWLFGWHETVVLRYQWKVDGDPTVTLNAGGFSLNVKGSGTFSTPVFDGSFKFDVTQTVTIRFDPISQSVVLTPVEPTVKVVGLPFGLNAVIETVAKRKIETARVKPLSDAQATINGALKTIDLNSALAFGSISNKWRYTSIETRSSGLILRGTATFADRPPVSSDFDIAAGGGIRFTAFNSWIPGGTVQEYVWTSSRVLPTFPFAEDVVRSEAHRFIFDVPSGTPKTPSQWCLEVRGTQQPTAAGSEQPAWGGATCSFVSPAMKTVLTTPIRKFPVPVIIPGDDSSPPSIAAHIDLGAVDVEPSEAQTPLLIHFADDAATLELSKLVESLAGAAPEGALSAVVVLPRGTLDAPASAIFEAIAETAQHPALAIALTEDYEQSWSRGYGVDQTPLTLLLGKDRQPAWAQSGPVDASTLASVVAQHIAPTDRHEWRLLRPGVPSGEPAPDLLFPYADGRLMALRKLRGQRRSLVFWTTWSSPCLAQLRSLSAREQTGERRQVVIAVNDGEDPEHASEWYHRHGFSFPLVVDPPRDLARAYGITCWPTTITIDEQGLIAATTFGATRRDHADRPSTTN